MNASQNGVQRQHYAAGFNLTMAAVLHRAARFMHVLGALMCR